VDRAISVILLTFSSPTTYLSSEFTPFLEKLRVEKCENIDVLCDFSSDIFSVTFFGYYLNFPLVTSEADGKNSSCASSDPGVSPLSCLSMLLTSYSLF